MKRLWEYGGMLLAVVAAGCSDSKNEPNVEPVTPVEPEKPVEIIMPDIDGKTYNTGDNFTLQLWYRSIGETTYDEIHLEKGQHVAISLENEDNAIIRFYSDDYDLADLGIDDISGKIARPTIWGIGNDISIPVNILADTVGSTGRYVAEGYTVVNDVKLVMDKVLITDNEFTGTMRFDISPDFEDVGLAYGVFKDRTPLVWIKYERDEEFDYKVNQIIKEWDSNGYPSDLKKIIEPADFLQLILRAPFIQAIKYGLSEDSESLISVTELFEARLKELYFPFDISAYPISPKFNYFLSSTFSCSQLTESSFLLHFDPNKMIRTKTTNESKRLYATIFNALTPYNSEGIPIDYHIYKHNNSLRALSLNFSDNSLSEKFTKNLLSALLYDEGNRSRLIEQLKQDENLSPHIDIIISMIENYKDLIAGTTKATVAFYYNVGQ